MVGMMTWVCSVDGVEIARSRTGHWVHLGELPKGVDPDHTGEAVSNNVYLSRHFAREGLRQVASDMLRHHGTIHPDSACEFAARLKAALRS